MFHMTRYAGVGIALVAGVGVVAAAVIQGGWLDAAMVLVVALGGAAFVLGVMAAARVPSDRVHAQDLARPDHPLVRH